jgi:hypothetical protein
MPLLQFFKAESHPLNLAVLRIIVFGMLLLIAFADPNQVVWFSGLPRDLLVPPPGWEAALPLLPIEPPIAAAALAVFAVSCSLALIGWHTRLSATVATLTGLYVLGVPQFYGKLNHHHHLLWFAALLAASPSGDAVSVDTLLLRRKGESRGAVVSTAYGLPLRFAWLLIGIIYFFPGLWKLRVVGWQWAMGGNLGGLLHEKWLELGGFVPIWRLDEQPLALLALGLFTLAFELSFLPLLFFDRLRPIAVLFGVAFHLGTWLFMRIFFLPLLVCYPVFVDWAALSGRRQRAPANTRRPDLTPTVAVGVLLLVTNAYAGARVIDSWPFAVYPTFAYLAPVSQHRIVLATVDAAGRERPYSPAAIARKMHSSRWNRLLVRISREDDPVRRNALLQALRHVSYATAAPPAGTRRIRFYRELWVTAPDQRHRNPIERVLLLETDAVSLPHQPPR